MTDINKIVQDPKFYKLSQQAQANVLDKVDPRFKALSPKAKLKVIGNLTTQSRFDPYKEPTKQPMSRQVARTGGGLVGGTLASLGGPTTWWSVPGAVGLGAMAGESAYQIGQHIFKDPNAPKTSLEAAKQMGIAGGTEAAFELGGQVVGRVGMKALAPFAKKMLPEADQAISLLKARIKPALLPSEATESRALDVLENITEGSILGGGKVSAFKLEREKVFEDMADDIITQYGQKVTPDEFGDLFVSAIENKQRLHRGVSNVLYNNVEYLAEGTQIKTGAIKKFSKPIARLSQELGSIESKNAGDDLITAIMELPDEISFEAAKDLRTRLMSRINEFQIVNKKAPAIGKAKKIIEILDNSIETSLPGEALKAWRLANKFYADWQQKYNNVFMRRLLKYADETGQGPQMIGKTIFKPNAIKNIQKIKTALGNKDYELFQSFAIQDIFKKSLSENGDLVGKKMMNNLFYKPTGIGQNTLKEVFSPEQFKELKIFAETLELAQRKQSEGLGRMWIQLAQGSAVASVGSAGLALDNDAMKGSAAFILFGPAILGRMMTKPAVVRYLTRGIKLPVQSPEIMGVLSRLTHAAYKIKTQE